MWACKAPPGRAASDQAPGTSGPPPQCRIQPQLRSEPPRCAKPWARRRVRPGSTQIRQ